MAIKIGPARVKGHLDGRIVVYHRDVPIGTFGSDRSAQQFVRGYNHGWHNRERDFQLTQDGKIFVHVHDERTGEIREFNVSSRQMRSIHNVLRHTNMVSNEMADRFRFDT